MPKSQSESEFWKIVDANFPEAERRERILRASEDESIDKLFIFGSPSYERIRRELEAAYFLSPEEVEEALIFGISRVANSIREDNQLIQRKISGGEA